MADPKSSDGAPAAGKWTSTQVYTLAIICLVAGLAIGYLFRGSASSARPSAAARQSADAGMPAPVQQQVTPERLKQMADKMAEPLLAQLEKNPNDAALLAKIGDTYSSARHFEIGQEYYRRSVAAKPDPGVMTRLATAYYYLGNADQAISTLNQALQQDPKYADALFNLGMLEWQAKSDPKAAIAAWQRLLKANPNHPKRAEVEQAIERARQHLNIPAGTKTDKPAM